MGVTVHCFAIDESGFETQELSVDSLTQAGVIDENLEVQPGFEHQITLVESVMKENKKWYLNMQAEDVYRTVRGHLSDLDCSELDELFRHFFWDPPNSVEEPGGLKRVADDARLYTPEYVDRVLAMANVDLKPLLALIPKVQAENPDERTQALWDPEMFQWWVEVWFSLFRRTRAHGKTRALLMWIWA